MLKAEELSQHYDYLKDALESLKKAMEIRKSSSLLEIKGKLLDEMERVLDMRFDAIHNELVDMLGEEEAKNIEKEWENARA